MERINENELLDLVKRLSIECFNKSFLGEVSFNNRLQTTGGRYIPALQKIELNPKYMVEMDEQEVIGIVKHELCHYHLHVSGQGYKHGDESFKQLLIKTGSPRFCNPLPSMDRRYKNIYKCSHCGYLYKRVRKIDVKRYKCGKCGRKLIKQ